MSHYFTGDNSLRHEIRRITYNFAGREYIFSTDAGVFSKAHIDPASDILLRALPPLSGSLLDLGCGYGCIGIALAGTYRLELTQADVNPRALELTRLNCEANGVASSVVESDIFENIDGSFDTITLNPPIHAGKAVTYRMFSEARPHLKAGGKLYVVMLKKHGAESALGYLAGIYSEVVTIYRKKTIYVFSCGV